MLLDKYLEGTASQAEQDLLLQYYLDCQESAGWDETELGSAYETEQAIWQRLQVGMDQKRVVPLYRRTWLQAAVAASVLLAVAMLFWWVEPVTPGTLQARTVVMPAFKPMPVQQATLTLSNGASKLLAGLADGIVATDGSFTIRKKGRLLVYAHATGVAAPGSLGYNMLALPSGSQYEVQLPDGSRVWLNATTAMRFPLHVTPGKHLVEIQGEAYFEVVKHPDRVFQVQPVSADGARRGTLVEVLGTHFNVEAYGDEQSIRTTLLEGKVKITGGKGAEALLAPGEQAVTADRKPVSVARVDVGRVVAWQQGLFDFKGANTRQVVQQLARWYGLSISYGRMDEALRFSGKISRRMSLADVLEILKQSGLHCTVESNTIIVGK